MFGLFIYPRESNTGLTMVSTATATYFMEPDGRCFAWYRQGAIPSMDLEPYRILSGAGCG